MKQFEEMNKIKGEIQSIQQDIYSHLQCQNEQLLKLALEIKTKLQKMKLILK
jgi:hypothetical protein